MAAADRLALLAGALLLLTDLSHARMMQSTGCDVSAAGTPPEPYFPGEFAPIVAEKQGSSKQSSCPDPRAVQPTSLAPFWLGTATAAHQVEGAYDVGGMGLSIWNTFEETPGKVAGNATAKVADDFFHKYEEDIQLMRYLGVRNFRLSFAWPRILPTGRGEPNPAGVEFYTRLIAALKAACIEPYATIYHWDLPQPLYDEYKGFIDPKVQDDFLHYAETVWRLFGDNITYWTTFNEPETFCILGYDSGAHAPGRCSDRTRCPEGNSTTEPWLCTYNVLNAHARAAASFKRLVPKGKLSINLSMQYYEPRSYNATDKDAAQRLMAFDAGRYLDAIYTGDWSPEVKLGAPEGALPSFSPEQSAALKAARPDWVALNHYTSRYVGYNETDTSPLKAFTTNTSAAGAEIPAADSPWLLIYPPGLRGILVWLKSRYSSPAIIITESGMSVRNESSLSLAEALCDRDRVSYYREYLRNAVKAVKEDGVDLQGFFAWSLMDNFEWADGYTKRFGICYVDFDSLKRYIKASGLWLGNYFGLITTKNAPNA